MDIISSTSPPSITASLLNNHQQIPSSSNLPISTSSGTTNTHSAVNSIIDSLPQSNSLDLSALFGDVSKTVSGLTDILSASAKNLASEGKLSNFTSSIDSTNSVPTGKDIFEKVASSGSENPSPFSTFADKLLDIAMPNAGSSNPLSGIFGGSSSCFKTCGMEDIQYASLKTAETMITLKYCLIFMTIATIMCMLALTGSILYFCFYKNRNNFDNPTTNGFQILNFPNKSGFGSSPNDKRCHGEINSDVNIKI
uniref:Uncharacterized protein n=1 Tax=Parastrongyloides trichosuri TaxID=131310 RepID=A0A0N4ZJ30_PARTI